jgi:hypothetical protein
MIWLQDVVISILFPYLLPSLPVCKSECWLKKKDIKCILEELLMFYCNIPVKRTQKLLEIFVRRQLGISCSYNRNLNYDLNFLAEIEERCSFTQSYQWTSNVHSFYACMFLIQQKVDIHEENDYALVWASRNGHKDVVALLLTHEVNVHARYDYPLRWASEHGHKDTVALLLEHKADVHAKNDCALRWASKNGHQDTVALLLKYRANIHAKNDCALQ